MSAARAIALLLIWCIALLAVRVVRSGSAMYLFLVWNLILAVVPAVAAVAFARARSTGGQILCAACWLAFLPNAPYIATDFIHLRLRPPVPLWYDAALLLSCALTGLLLGYVSVAEVQSVLRRKFGEMQSWVCAIAALLLCGFGIYLGRFLRWNSWQIATDPLLLLTDILHRVANPLSHPRTMAVTIVYGVGLVVGYLVWTAVGNAPSRSLLHREEERCPNHPMAGTARRKVLRSS